jgi:DNA-binding CsgD family transcriptional regulator
MRLEKKTKKTAAPQCPGVMLFSAALDLLCCDERAEALCQKLKILRPATAPSVKKIPLPAIIRQHTAELLKMLRARRHLKDCKDFKIRRVLTRGKHKLFVDGFGFPQAADKGRPLILLLLQEVEDQAAETTLHARQVFGLSDREGIVLQHLLKGRTNKEIAEALSITENCVKQHFKHIMMKTQSSTRTGVLLSVLAAQGFKLS